MTGTVRQTAPAAPLRAGRRLVRADPREPSRRARALRRLAGPLLALHVPRGVGIAATALVICASAGYGAVKGDHVTGLVEWFKDVRDIAANAAGFQIVTLALSGNRHVSRDEILTAAGLTSRRSLLFLDVEEVREKLQANPWIADATVLKLYPGELQIGIKERNAFALWQKDGKVSVIAEDGTVVEPFVAPALLRLPLVVGRGAETHAKAFLDVLERYPEIHEQVRASVLVGGRRWNLRLKNGLDVRLPEVGIERAFELLTALDRETKLVSRDIVAIDLRLPDRVTVKLSPAAAKARADALKEKNPPAKKGEKA